MKSHLLYKRHFLMFQDDIDGEVNSAMIHAGYISSWDIPVYLT
jgi:hypothetical protein